MNKKIILLLLMANCFCLGASAQQWAVKTNLLYWATATPNVGVEYAVSQHSTLGLSANYNPWTFGNGKIQHWFIQPEYKYWFTGKYTRLYVGAHVLGGKFEIGGFEFPILGDRIFRGMKDNYYKGSVVAGGISVGYDFYLSPHLNLELSAGVGLARINYHLVPTQGAAPASYQSKVKYLPVPTDLGFRLVYLFNSKK